MRLNYLGQRRQTKHTELTRILAIDASMTFYYKVIVPDHTLVIFSTKEVDIKIQFCISQRRLVCCTRTVHGKKLRHIPAHVISHYQKSKSKSSCDPGNLDNV